MRADVPETGARSSGGSTRHGLSEPEAMARLERLAKTARRTVGEIAKVVIGPDAG